MFGTDCKVTNRINELALSVEAECHSMSDASFPARVHKICNVMRDAGIVAAHELNYYAVENSFIHFALQGRGGLPIFTGSATRCGITAAPVNCVSPKLQTSIHYYSRVMYSWQSHLLKISIKCTLSLWMCLTRDGVIM